ncbi:ankyrin repeat-containing protein [Penicillium subrubescens]|uniref:Ankyrin-1 n=1 Tax=Penicillium subrubescens TaxID=1316194 RepID=A0A1Q5UNW6_9EURO|nr:ankyrin repeat-containing protein [Penicillium subrubescens]KAJ5905637.1 ankyrin repeat-containing protein [Penicillium subrubescens]OKP14160.1 Ankyrin-1 [Penicillium subrubescens]
MSLASLPPELLQMVARAITDTRQGRSQPSQTLKTIYALSRTCRATYLHLCWNLYRYDADRGHSTALVWAAVTNNPQTVRLSLASGGNTRATNQHGQSSLWLAARRGHREIVEILLDHGADIEIRNPVGLTPLAIAAREGQCEVMKVLLDRGANHAAQARDHSTPLLWAIRNGAVDAVKMLIEHGAQFPEPKTTHRRRWALAAYRAGPDRWADIPEIETLMESSYDGNQNKLLSQKPLLNALRFQHLAMSTFFLDQCITPVSDLASFFGYSPADEPVHDKTRHGREQVDFTREKAREQWHYFGRPDDNPMWWAVQHGEEEIVEKLLRRGAGTNSLRHWSPSIGQEPRNLIALAIVRGYYGIAERLLDYGTDPSYQFHDGPLLRRVLEIGNERLVMKVLLSLKRHGAHNIANYGGYVAIAIGKKNAMLVKMLLEFGADPNSKVFYHRGTESGSRHKALLSLAIEIGNQDVVDTLLEYGAG